MSKHTKGPWIAEFTVPEEGWNGFYILTKDERLYIADAAGYQDMPERAANARLIAAAPDLLEACENALTCIEAMADRIDEDCGARGCMCTMPGNIPHSQTYRDGEIAMLRAAIAKARGEVTP